jgi:predicted  nucleic acid-binding Zn-ribbon protein
MKSGDVDTNTLRGLGEDAKALLDDAADRIEALEQEVAELTTRCGDYEEEIASLNELINEMGAE